MAAVTRNRADKSVGGAGHRRLAACAGAALSGRSDQTALAYGSATHAQVSALTAGKRRVGPGLGQAEEGGQAQAQVERGRCHRTAAA